MIFRVLAGSLVLAALVAAAGCGGSGGGRATTTVAVTTAPTVQGACRRLNASTQRAVKQIGASIATFATIRSVSSLSTHAAALQHRIEVAGAQIEAVRTPPGPVTHDKQALARALRGLAHKLAVARSAAAAGKVGTAARQFAALGRLAALRGAAQSLARDCPPG